MQIKPTSIKGQYKIYLRDDVLSILGVKISHKNATKNDMLIWYANAKNGN